MLGRTGTITTPHGQIQTPAFIPVGTLATVKAVLPESMGQLGAQALLSNAYHLYLQPGPDVVDEAGGLGSFMNWQGPTFTDSGGFQVLSLGVGFKKILAMDAKTVRSDEVIAPGKDRMAHVDDDGVTFKSTYDGSNHRFTPESAIATQELLGADIQMVLDVCAPLPSPQPVIRLALERTSMWAQRAHTAHQRTDQALFGIVQGGTDIAMRAESAQRTVAITTGDRSGFDGYGIGGLSVGETREEMIPALASAIAHLPTDRPRYLMGVGDPASLIEAVWLGVDQFDCVMQTRIGRHGTALTSTGKLHIKNQRHALSEDPIDSACSCDVCKRHTRGYIRHLFQVNEPTAARLLSLHNIAFTLNLMKDMREAIGQGRLHILRQEILAIWG